MPGGDPLHFKNLKYLEPGLKCTFKCWILLKVLKVWHFETTTEVLTTDNSQWRKRKRKRKKEIEEEKGNGQFKKYKMCFDKEKKAVFRTLPKIKWKILKWWLCAFLTEFQFLFKLSLTKIIGKKVYSSTSNTINNVKIKSLRKGWATLLSLAAKQII